MEKEKELIETVARHDVEIKNIKDDVSELKTQNETLHRMATSIELLAQQGSTTNDNIENVNKNLSTKIDKVDGKVNKLDKDLTEVKVQSDKKDAAKWNNAVKYVLTAIGGAIVTLVLKHIGLI